MGGCCGVEWEEGGGGGGAGGGGGGLWMGGWGGGWVDMWKERRKDLRVRRGLEGGRGRLVGKGLLRVFFSSSWCLQGRRVVVGGGEQAAASWLSV